MPGCVRTCQGTSVGSDSLRPYGIQSSKCKTDTSLDLKGLLVYHGGFERGGEVSCTAHEWVLAAINWFGLKAGERVVWAWVRSPISSLSPLWVLLPSLSVLAPPFPALTSLCLDGFLPHLFQVEELPFSYTKRLSKYFRKGPSPFIKKILLYLSYPNLFGIWFYFKLQLFPSWNALSLFCFKMWDAQNEAVKVV